MTKDVSGEKKAAPRKRRKYRSAQENIARILEVALDEFKKKGYDKSTTANIAKRAQVVEPQIFQYFGSKSNLFRSAIFDTLNRQLDAVASEYQWENDDSSDRPSKVGQTVHTERLQNFLNDNVDLIKSLFIANAYGAFEAPAIGVDDSLARYFERGVDLMKRTKMDAGGVPPHLMVRISFGAVLGCVLFRDWLFPGEIAEESEVVPAITQFVLAGLKASSQPEGEKGQSGQNRIPE